MGIFFFCKYSSVSVFSTINATEVVGLTLCLSHLARSAGSAPLRAAAAASAAITAASAPAAAAATAAAAAAATATASVRRRGGHGGPGRR